MGEYNGSWFARCGSQWPGYQGSVVTAADKLSSLPVPGNAGKFLVICIPEMIKDWCKLVKQRTQFAQLLSYISN